MTNTALKIAILLLALTSGCAGAVHRIAQVTEVTAYGATACDYGSTHSAMSRGNHYTETNMVLGEHPDDVTLTGYFALVESGVWFANRTLPDWARVALNVTITVAEVYAERGNHSVGVPSCGL